MHASRAACGVRGLFPYLRKHAPECFTSIRTGVGLAHARIAIDATLLTQRLFFRNDGHVARHLIGMYRVVDALRRVGAQPLMVFDHLTARLPEKQREQEKRRQLRDQNSFRLRAETERGARLRALQRCIATFEQMPPADRMEAARLLRVWRAHATPPAVPAFDACAPGDLAALEAAATWVGDGGAGPWAVSWADAMAARGAPPDGARAPPRDEVVMDAPDGSGTSGREADDRTCVATEGAPPARAIDAMRTSALYTAEAIHELQYSAPAPEQLWPPAPASHTLARQIHTLHGAWLAMCTRERADGMAQSASQRPLIHAEGTLYEALRHGLVADGRLVDDELRTELAQRRVLPERTSGAGVRCAPAPPENTAAPAPASAPPPRARLIHFLVHESTKLAATYAKASRVLNEDIFQQSMHLCRLLGVPVFVTGDGSARGGCVTEAEAFASALVASGYADIVASEDSDVVLYGVPLLRGLAGHAGALELVHSRRVPGALFPHGGAAGAAGPRNVYRVQRALLLQFALLCGTDFNRTIPRVGAVTAHRLLAYVGAARRSCHSIHGTVRNVLMHDARYTPPDGLTAGAYLSELAAAERIFETLPDVSAAVRAAGLSVTDAQLPVAGDAPAWAHALGVRARCHSVSDPPCDDAEVHAYLRENGVHEDVLHAEMEDRGGGGRGADGPLSKVTLVEGAEVLGGGRVWGTEGGGVECRDSAELGVKRARRTWVKVGVTRSV
ncbi:hypothetical protein MSPP1_000991 [Malassezia sp. CBS 17886]|nr:hypothetical protein MSPP1_000991 [Malassezia sp. CBS 17886]